MAAHYFTKELEIKCFECQKECPTIYKLQTHINTNHTVREKATCEICGLVLAGKHRIARKVSDFN